MAIIKCPRCDINFIREEDGYCDICKREMKGIEPKNDLPEMCIECGENPALPGDDLCAACLIDRKLAEEVAKELSVDETAEDSEDIGIVEMDDALKSDDIPDTELEVIHKELSFDEIEEGDDDDADSDSEEE